MKKMFLLSLLALLCCAGTSLAGGNAGAVAYLSTSATTNNYVICPAAGATTLNLFVRLDRPGSALQFKGGEVDLQWCPAGDGAGCYDYITALFKTSGGTTCTYLNRGAAASPPPVVEANHIHIAWASDQCFTSCTAGAIVQLQWDITVCAELTNPPPATFTLNNIKVVDCQSVEDVLAVAPTGSTVTVCGGCPTPTTPATWGKIKALYKN